MISSDLKVSLHDLQTVYGVKDLYNFLEIIAVNASNTRLAAKLAKERDQ